MKYPLASISWNQEEYKAALEVLASDMFTMGPKTKLFEEKFASWTGSKFAVFCNSGSSANLLALACLLYHPEVNLNIGDEVIVPVVSWSTTYYPILQLGLKPIFVDCASDTMNIDVDKVSNAITSKTKGIFAVNLLGNPNNFDELDDICKQHGLWLLEDNCESMGAVYKGKKTGSIGYIGTHSTFFSHHIATMEGGVCVTDDPLAYDILKSLRAHGWTRDVSFPDLFYSYFPRAQNEFLEKFHFVLPGYNMRPTEMSASIGFQQMEKIDAFISNRRLNAAAFKEVFNNHKDKISIQKEVGDSSWFGFGILFDNEKIRDQAVKLFGANEIECRPIVSGNMLRQPVFRTVGLQPEQFLGAEKIHHTGVMVGNHQFDITAQIHHLDSVLSKL